MAPGFVDCLSALNPSTQTWVVNLTQRQSDAKAQFLFENQDVFPHHVLFKIIFLLLPVLAYEKLDSPLAGSMYKVTDNLQSLKVGR